MAIVTIQATTNQTPDPSLGTDLAMTTPTNTGHADSQAIDTGPPAAQAKSIRWSGFAASGGQVTKVTLKFDWAIPSGGGTTTGAGTASASFNVLVSTDGGSTFPTTALTRSFNINGDNSASLVESGSVSFDITPVPSTAQVQIRERLTATASTVGGSASVTTNISNLALQVTRASTSAAVMM